MNAATPSITNIAYPGQSSPYLKSSYGWIFYSVWAVFIGIAAILYYGNESKTFELKQTVLYVSMMASVVVGLFIADRIQYVYNNQGGIMMYPNTIPSKTVNVETPEDTDGKTGSQRGSGILASYSFWVYDNDTETPTNKRYLMTRNKYSDKDLTMLNEEGKRIPDPTKTQYPAATPSIHMNEKNEVVYKIDATRECLSAYAIPKQEWTCVQIIQTIDDVSIYFNNRLDSVHVMDRIENPDTIHKGRIVMFPSFNTFNTDGTSTPPDTQRQTHQFNLQLSRVFFSNRAITPGTQKNLYEMGPVQGSIPFEILKSILGIPYVLSRSLFV